MLLACADDQVGAGTSAPAIQPGPSNPASAELADIYNRSCRSCHAQGAASAPRTGDLAAWADRLDQGMDTLLKHTVEGYQGMPPMGMCFDCSESDFAALITFMSTGEG